MSVRRVAALSMHTSPLAQPGRGDGGGLNVYVRSLASALARAGVPCDVFTRAERPDLPMVVDVEPGVRVVHIEAGPRAEVPKEQLPDLVDEFTEGVRAFMEASAEPYDVLHAHYWLSAVAAHTLKHALDLPLVTTFHTLALVKAAAGLGDEPLERIEAEQSVVQCCDIVTAATADEESELVGRYGVDLARLAIVTPGVDHQRFAPGDRDAARRRLGVGAGPVLLFAGRIQPLKGGDLAIEALAGLDRPDAVLLFVGDPSGADGAAEAARLRTLAAARGVADRVRFVGSVPHDDLPDYYVAADVCIVPSRTESFGLVALEAAACGTPVVAAAVGGLASIVDDGRTGVLVAQRSAADYTAAVQTVLDDPALAASMSAAATERSMRYSWNITAARLRRLYSDLATREPVRCR